MGDFSTPDRFLSVLFEKYRFVGNLGIRGVYECGVETMVSGIGKPGCRFADS